MTEKTPSAPFASGNPPAIGTPGMSPPLTSSTRSAAGARSRRVTSRLAAISGDTTDGGGAGGAAVLREHGLGEGEQSGCARRQHE